MAAIHDDIAADEMDDQTCDQTRQNSAGQVSNSENKVHTFSNQDSKRFLKLRERCPDTKWLNYKMAE